MPNSQPTGFGAIGYALGGGFERDRETQRKQLQQQANVTQAGISKSEQETEKLKLQNQQLQMQQKMVQNQLVSKDLTFAMDDFVETGNTEVMNMVIKSNPFLAAKMEKNYGVNEVANFDFIGNEEHQRLAAKSLNLSEDIVKDMLALDPTILSDFQKGFVVSKSQQGDKLTSIAEFAQQTGYLKQVSSHKAKAFRDTMAGVKNLGKTLTANQQKDKRALAYFENPENKGKTWSDFEQEDLGTVPDIKSQQAKELLRLTKDEGLSFQDAMKQIQAPATKGRITTANLKDEYANLQVAKSNNELSKDQETRLRVLDKLFSTDSDEKRDILEKGIQITDKYSENLFDQDIEQKDIIDSKLFSQQAGIKPDTKSNRDFKDQFNTVKTGFRLVEEVNGLDDEELSRGLIDTGIQKAKKLLSDTSFKELPDEDKAKAINSIKMNTKLGMFLAKYIKSISGTAVAQAEYDRLTGLFTGSSFENIQALKAGVSEFVNELDISFRDTAQTSLLDNPSTTLDLVKRYKKMKRPEQPQEVAEAPVEPKQYKQTATNPSTGERMGLTDTGWEVIK